MEIIYNILTSRKNVTLSKTKYGFVCTDDKKWEVVKEFVTNSGYQVIFGTSKDGLEVVFI